MEEDKVVTVESPSVPRENMISTAVRFLQNPKVTESPVNQKRTFLEKKGLTSEEIDLAIARAGVTESAAPSQPSGVMAPVPGAYPMAVQPMIPQPVPVSLWVRFKDYTATAIVIAGISYGLYKFYKTYIMPLWFGPSAEERQLVAIHKSITELQTNITDTLTYIKEMQTSINTQQDKLQEMSTGTRPRSSSEEKIFVKEVKDEIKSLKGLLLSRKQFPPTPSSQPVLPAWQLASPKIEEKPTTGDSHTETPDTSMSKVPSTETISEDIPVTESASEDISETATVSEDVPATATLSEATISEDVPLTSEDTPVTGTPTQQQVMGDTSISSDSVVTQSQVTDNAETSVLVNGHLHNGVGDDNTGLVQSIEEHPSKSSNIHYDQSTVTVES